MNKELEKLLFNPIRLKILSFLFTVESASFKKLMEVSGATKGNISIQIKKLEDAGCIKIKKKFEGNYPALFVLYIFQIINPINIYGIDIR